MPKVAILDDYARVALELADWSSVQARADVKLFDRHLSEDEAAEALQSFDVVCTLRERMAFPRTLIERLPNLRLMTIVGMSLANLDMAAATEHGILVAYPNFANPAFAAAGASVGRPFRLYCGDTARTDWCEAKGAFCKFEATAITNPEAMDCLTTCSCVCGTCDSSA